MANIVRLVNGGTIQVRTGVLQGIGPQGATGPNGPEGPQGPVGPQGETGPMGQILQQMSRAKISSAVSVNPDTNQLVSFGTVAFDQLGCIQGSNFVFSQPGDYLFNILVRFNLPANAGDGIRAVYLQSSAAGEIARVQVPAVSDDATYLNLSWPHKIDTTPETLNIYVRQSDDLAVSLADAAVAISRIGSGPQGPVGPQGPQGPTGATGPQGNIGPAGVSGAGYSTYSALTSNPAD